MIMIKRQQINIENFYAIEMCDNLKYDIIYFDRTITKHYLLINGKLERRIKL